MQREMEREGREHTIRTSDCVPSLIWLIKHIHLCFIVDVLDGGVKVRVKKGVGRSQFSVVHTRSCP